MSESIDKLLSSQFAYKNKLDTKKLANKEETQKKKVKFLSFVSCDEIFNFFFSKFSAFATASTVISKFHMNLTAV